MLRLLLSVIVSMLGFKALAQWPHDSVFRSKPRFTFSLDNRTTRMMDGGVQIQGIKLGLEWQQKYRAGLAYYNLGSKVYMPVTINALTVQQRLRVWYMSAYAEYAFYESRRWAFSVPLQVGIGGKYFKYNLYNEEHTRSHGLILMAEPGISGHYKLLSFVGLACDIGYRQLALTNWLNTEKLSGPFISFRVKVFPKDLYNTVFMGESPYLQR